MKSNHCYHWTITLRGKTKVKKIDFVGTCDEALSKADEQECCVCWHVIHYEITRGAFVV